MLRYIKTHKIKKIKNFRKFLKKFFWSPKKFFVKKMSKKSQSNSQGGQGCS